MHLEWDFLETLDEMVYITDVERNQLVYMNRYLRERLGFDREEDYVGQLCYKVLQGYDAPCAFCNNSQLQVGSFMTWFYESAMFHKRFLIKDTLVEREGRVYRVEIAVDLDKQEGGNRFFPRSDTILNECLRCVYDQEHPDDALMQMLRYLGEQFSCDRACIYEMMGEDRVSNTYEWCAPGVTSQQERLRDDSVDTIRWWLDSFQCNEIVVVPDIEQIRTQHPASYAVWKPQEIHSVVAGPIRADGKIVGALGLDNPDMGLLTVMTPVLQPIGYFIESLFKRRDLFHRLEELSFHDPLTGALNRNALSELYRQPVAFRAMGAIYCDLSGLKRVNDTQGHEAGDRMILHCCRLIQQAVGDWKLYRIGGDEFLALGFDVEQDAVLERARRLKQAVAQDQYHIAVGHAWSDQTPLELEPLIAAADRMMYQDKQEYYSIRDLMRQQSGGAGTQELVPLNQDSQFKRYIRSYYYDAEAMFASLAFRNAQQFLYFGDVQKNVFYISDAMRDRFGFAGNLVPDLAQEWEQRICTREDRNLYRRDVERLLQEKRGSYDLRYQVRDAADNRFWVRNCGMLQWNADRTVPLFFSGRISIQEQDYSADPMTGFQREFSARLRLDQLRQQESSVWVVGFSLNHLPEINEARGHHRGNLLIQHVAARLMEHMEGVADLYRLDGIHFLAITRPEWKGYGPQLVERMKELVAQEYRAMEFHLPNPCSCALVSYPRREDVPQLLLEQIQMLVSQARATPAEPYITPSQEGAQQLLHMSEMAAHLERCVQNGMRDFRIVIQPVLSSPAGELAGGEVLLRWKYRGEDIAPTVFLRMLERSGAILPVGRWVFEQVVRVGVRITSHAPRFLLAFNLSHCQVEDSDFWPFVEDRLAAYAFDPGRLVAEVGESPMGRGEEKQRVFLQECRQRGIRTALDTLQSGSLALSTLMRSPVDVIKVDCTMLEGLPSPQEGQRLMDSLVYACHQFGKQVCVKRVEGQEEDELLRVAGCDYLQGFRYHHPLELDQLYQLLTQGR